MSSSFSALYEYLYFWFEYFCNTIYEIYHESHIVTLLIICSIILLLTIQFLRYLFNLLFDSPNINDLSYLRFQAAPAGDRAAVISIQGQRKYMEDTYQAIPHLNGHSNWSYYGVYDGHGGARCSVYVAHYLHKHVLAWTNAYIQHYANNSQRLINQLLNETKSYKTVSCNKLNNDNDNDNDCNTNTNTKDNKQQNTKKNTKQTDNKKQTDTGNSSTSSGGIPLCILKIMNEILLKSHRKADQEFLQLANRQRWKDGSTSVCCVILPAKDLLKSLIDKTFANKILNNNNNNKDDNNSDNNNSNNNTLRLRKKNGLNKDTNNSAHTSGSTDNNDKRRNERINNIISSLCSDSDRWIFVANTGDSRCILVSSSGLITEMSHDHKPNTQLERNRIQSTGGRIVFFGTWRVEGVLAVSRSFGDRLLKRWIIPDPEVIGHKINNSNDLFLILATDGVWDTVSNNEAAKCAIECWNNPKLKLLNLNKRLRNIAQKITSFAYTRGSMDNITTLIIHLPSHTHVKYKYNNDDNYDK